MSLTWMPLTDQRLLEMLGLRLQISARKHQCDWDAAVAGISGRALKDGKYT